GTRVRVDGDRHVGDGLALLVQLADAGRYGDRDRLLDWCTVGWHAEPGGVRHVRCLVVGVPDGICSPRRAIRDGGAVHCPDANVDLLAEPSRLIGLDVVGDREARVRASAERTGPDRGPT